MFTFSGFRDGHCHPLFASREGQGPDVTGLESASQIAAVLGDFLKSHPETVWLDCGSYSPDLVASDDLNRATLDAASTTVPIVVHASDHHSIWVNSAALKVAGFSDSAPALEHARFATDTDGRPSGLVFEWDAMSLIYAHQPKPSLESDLEALDRAQRRLLAAGVVAVQDAWIDRDMETPYLEAARTGQLRVRVNLAPRIDAKQWRNDLNFAKGVRASTRAVGNELLTCNTVKIFIDGVIGAKTALLRADYCGGGNGQGLWQLSELLEMALVADSAGFQLHFHAIGDAAVDMALDAIEHISLCNGLVDRRPVIAHADLIDQASLPRMREFGVISCMQPAWAVPGPELNAAVKLLGNNRASRLYPLRSLLDAGVRVSFGSDWPVSPPEPVHGLWGATLRRSAPESAAQHSPEQAISRSEAIFAYSTAVAHQLGQESAQDVVTFDVDLLTCSPSEMLTATATSVTVAGRKVWPY